MLEELHGASPCGEPCLFPKALHWISQKIVVVFPDSCWKGERDLVNSGSVRLSVLLRALRAANPPSGFFLADLPRGRVLDLIVPWSESTGVCDDDHGPTMAGFTFSGSHPGPPWGFVELTWIPLWGPRFGAKTL